MGFTPTDSIWFNGTLVPWADARVHVLAHGLHYGTGVFEGMRSYPTPDGPAVFRLDAHLDRFYASAQLYDLEIPYSRDALFEATLEVIRANRLESSYVRPIAFFDAATLSVWTKECPVTVAIAAFPTGQYHAGGPDHGTDARTSLYGQLGASRRDRLDDHAPRTVRQLRAAAGAQRRDVERGRPQYHEGRAATPAFDSRQQDRAVARPMGVRGHSRFEPVESHVIRDIRHVPAAGVVPLAIPLDREALACIP